MNALMTPKMKQILIFYTIINIWMTSKIVFIYLQNKCIFATVQVIFNFFIAPEG